MTYSVSLVMIVRDEERCLARCLDSVAHLVDEIVVVDTGSTDHTIAIAESYGAKVSHFDWIDDFSAARNFALDQATGDWRLILDADDWLVEGADYLADLRATRPDFLGEVRIVDHWGTPEHPRRAQSSIPRLLPRGARYEFPIHEQPRLPDGQTRPARVTPLVYESDGYLAAQTARKGMRNLRLLRKAVEQDPAHPYFAAQLGVELHSLNRWAEAIAQFEKAWDLAAGDWRMRHLVGTRWIQAVTFSGEPLKALDLGTRLAGEIGMTAEFWFTLAEAAVKAAETHPAEAADLYALAASFWRTCLDLGDTEATPVNVEGRGTFMPAHNLATYYEGVGDAAQAAHYRALADRLLAEHGVEAPRP